MIEHLLLFFALLAIIIALVMVSNRLKVAYPVLLVLGGLAISFVPNLPSIKIDPELIFIIFLPPLLYEAAWANSLKELFKWRRMIGSFAFIVGFHKRSSSCSDSKFSDPWLLASPWLHARSHRLATRRGEYGSYP